MGAVRTLTVWCPDWPIVAVGGGEHGALTVPGPAGPLPTGPGTPAVATSALAVVQAGRVVAANAAARAEGVRRGMRRREAQSRCPGLSLLPRDENREASAFEPVVAALAAVCPRVEVVRPGLAAFATRGPARYFGGDAKLALVAATTVGDVLGDVLGGEGSATVGIADGAFASRLAAREGVIVPAGGSAAWLAPFGIAELDAPELVDLLQRLGVRTLGEYAALPRPEVASRFGADGVRAHRLARGLDERPLAAVAPPPEMTVRADLDPPAERIDEAAFVAKSLADRLHAELARRGLACTRVLVEAETEHGEYLARVWRHDGVLSAAAIAERVRWQLAGWLTGPVEDRPSAGIVTLRLAPDDVHPDAGRQLGLWGGATLADERAARALARVQGLLGPDGVVTAVVAGGRGPAEQVCLVPWGEPQPPAYDGTPPWPGAIPAPAPATVHAEPVPAEVVDAAGRPVTVDGRAAVGAEPARLRVGGRWAEITGWAGPWPADERWWDPAEHRRLARFQVVTADGTARLLTVEHGRWWVEATYD